LVTGCHFALGSFSDWMQLSALPEGTAEKQIWKRSGSVVWLWLCSASCAGEEDRRAQKKPKTEMQGEQVQMLHLPCFHGLRSLLTHYIKLVCILTFGLASA